MSQVEYEAANFTAPFLNSASMKCIHVVGATSSSAALDLETVYGQLTNGNFITLCCLDAAVFVAFSNATGTIDNTATGNGSTVCFPIPAGVPMSFRLYEDRFWLIYKTASSNASLYIYRSSVLPSSTPSRDFPAP